MVPFTVAQAAAACGGKYVGDEGVLKQSFAGVTIDSRAVKQGFLFIPVKGEKFDGHDFIPAAFNAGALCSLSERPLETTPYILVGSTLDALQGIAAFYRSLFTIPVVGITGSVGKTTTKELIALALSLEYDVLKNEGNLNNQTGVPLTVFRLEPHHEAAVIEMGMNHFGEIRNLSRIVRPKICVITNIGEAHIEYLGSKEGILKAKSEMLEYMEEGGSLVINGDDPTLRNLLLKYPDAVTYGFGEHNRVRAKDVYDMGFEGSQFTACFEGKEIEVSMPAPGNHMIMNALAALAVGRLLGVDVKKIREGLNAYQPAEGRMHVTDTGKIKIINDAYNANPTSMAASISIAAKAQGRSVCILGDMFELGQEEAAYHKAIGRHAAEEDIKIILCVGPLSKYIFEAATEKKAKAMYFPDKETLIKNLPSIIRTGDTVLVKASHGMHLEEVAQWLKNNY